METLSIVIPVHNRAALLEECLASVAAQTYRPLQVIIVDNGSTDGSAGVAVEWGRRVSAPNLEVAVLTESQRGAARARQAGALQAKGRVIAFVDSDDTLRPHYAASIMEAFGADSKIELVWWRKQCLFPDGRSRQLRFARRLTMGGHVAHGLLNTLGCAVRASLYRRSGGWNVELRQWDDWELGIRYITNLRGKSARIDKVLVDIRAQADSITGTDYRSSAGGWERSVEAAVAVAETLEPEQRTALLRLLAFKMAILAAHYSREGDTQLGRKTLRAAKKLLSAGRGSLLLRLVYAYTRRGLRGAASWALPFLTSY